MFALWRWPPTLLRLQGLRLLVLSSSWLVCHFSLAFSPLPGGWPAGRGCSCPASGARRTHPTQLLCQRLPPSCRAQQLEPRLLELWRWFSKTLWGFEALVFWGNMRGIQIVDITLTSPAIFQHCFQSKKFPLHRNVKLPSVKPGVLICVSVPEGFFSLRSPESAALGRIKRRLMCPSTFLVLCKSYLWYAHKRSGKFSLCPKLIVTSNDKLSLE